MSIRRSTSRGLLRAALPLALSVAAGGARGQFVLRHAEGVPMARAQAERESVAADSHNPVRLSADGGGSRGAARLFADFARGDFRAVDDAEESRRLGAEVDGFKAHDGVWMAGVMGYANERAWRTSWRSALLLHPRNPFVLADSLPSDKAVETFAMRAAVAWRFASVWRAGVEAGLTIGVSADQEDPRPKISTSAVPLAVGVARGFGSLSAGLSAGVGIYRSAVDYSVQNALIAYRYFLMKGMGDYQVWSSSATPGYQRRYSGGAWRGAAQVGSDADDAPWRWHAEAGFERGWQDAEDGGSAYSFRGGDYSFSAFWLSARAMVRGAAGRHNVVLRARRHDASGDWYDQRARTDTERANRRWYEVLAKTRVHDDDATDVCVGYHLDFESSAKFRLAYAEAEAGWEADKIGHHNALGLRRQEWDALRLRMALCGEADIGVSLLRLALHGGGFGRLGGRVGQSASFADTGNDITAAYVNSLFEFASANRLNVGGVADVSFPLPRGGVRLGAVLWADWWRHLGTAEFMPAMRGARRTLWNVALYARF